MGRRKKGKKKQDNAPTSHSCLNTHVTEELEALEAIFGDLYAVLEDGMGCKVTYDSSSASTLRCGHRQLFSQPQTKLGVRCRCIPFLGGSNENDRVVSLEARFPEHYPHKPVHIQLSDVQGLRQSDVEELQKLLEGKSIEHADSGMVAVHNLAMDCSEWLQTATRADENEQASLYDAYQQRETAGAKLRHADMRNRFATLTMDWFSRSAEPVLQEGQGQGRRPLTASGRPAGETKEAEAHATGRSLTAVDLATSEESGTWTAQAVDRQAEPHKGGHETTGEPRVHRSGLHSNGPRSGPLASVLSRSMGLVTSALRGLRSRRTIGEPTLSRKGSSNARVVLQELLNLDSKESCQQALTIAALHQNFSQAGVASAAQHALVEQMVKSGVVSSAAGALLLEADGMRDFMVWVEGLDAAVCPPALREMLLRTPAAGASTVQGGPCMGSDAKPNRRSQSVSTLAFQGRAPPAPARDARPRRYEMEFIEQERLGQGGFGVVVAAVNRIDGRRYAVKKIPMAGADMGATTLREVSTLSGLHHGHIVRYYQAWREHVDHKLDDISSVDESGVFACHTTPPHSDSAPTVASAHHMRSSTMWSIDSEAHADGVRPNVSSGVLDTVREASQDLGSTPSQHAQVPRSTLDGASASGAGGGSESTSKATPRSPKQLALGVEDSDAVSGLREDGNDSVLNNTDKAGDLVQFPDEGGSGQLETAPFHDATVAETTTTSADTASGDSLSSSEGFSGNTPSFYHKSQGGNSAFTFAHSHSQHEGTASVVTTRTPAKVSQEILYIQMEFCPTTLKRQLRKGPFKDEHAWRVLRQLLSALAYLHQRGIIHRDVKPDNVFYDSRNDIKLGDFGLAKFTTQETAAQAGQDHPRHGKDRAQDPTAADAYSKDVGTELYIAPEVRAGRQYGSKVDIFAVGIIIVEIWSEFKTEMERIQTLLRVRDGELPEYMWQHHQMAARLAAALLQKDPARRPGAAEVLKSHMMPATATDEQVTDLLRAMPEHPDVFYRLVDALFTESSSAAADESSEGAKGSVSGKKAVAQLSVSSDIMAAGVPVARTSATQLAIMHCVERVCSAHSCLQMQSRVLGASTSVTAPEAAKLLSSSGQQLALRSPDLRTPFCVWLAAQAQAASTASFSGPGMECMRRYEISQVYMRNVETPKWLAAIDIVRAGADHAAGRDAPMLAEAELIRMSCDICSSVEALKGCNIDIQLSHASLLVAVLDHLGVGEAVQDSFVQALQTLMASRLPGEKASAAGLKSKPWAAFCQSLQQLSLSIGRVKPLLMSLPTDPRDAVTWLRSVLPQAADSASPAAQALTDLDKLIEMLDVWEVAQNTKAVSLSVDPFMLIPSREFQSVFFRVGVWQDKAGDAEVTGECICTGGCYSSFLAEIWPLQASGTTIDLTAMTELASKLEVARMPTERSLSSAEVLVACRGGGGMLKERMAVVSQLWRSNLPAETMQVLEPSAKQQYVYAHARGVKALVILEPQNFESKKVKVKLLDRKAADTLQNLDDLVPHLLSVLGSVQRT